MQEGWLNDEYLVLFAEEDAERYGLESVLSGYRIVGLLGWDDFLVEDQAGVRFRVPTVPCVPKNLAPIHLPAKLDGLVPDDRFRGKVKWYIKPLLFGGDAGVDENITWVTFAEHAQLVQWWNVLFRDLQKKQ